MKRFAFGRVATTVLGLLTLSAPAWAQIELTGSYVPRMYEDFNERGPGSDMGDFTGAAGRFAFGELWARPQLSRRDRSLVVCATLTTQDKPTELRFHLQGALNHGVTLGELEELMVTVIGYVGFPTAVEGFRALREVQARQ